jgi:hypothetical protein
VADSILTICQDVSKEAGLGSPPTIVGATDDTGIQLLAMANRAGRNLARRSWQILQKEHTFTTVAAQASYALPADYARYLDDTAWDRSSYWSVRGSLSPQEWQRYKSGIVASSPRSRFRVKAGALYIDPTPTAAKSMVIEYVSNAWVLSGGVAFTKIQADTDTVVFDDDLFKVELLWRFLNRKGLAYGEEKREAELLADKLIGMDTPSSPVSMDSDTSPFLPPPQPGTIGGGGSGSSGDFFPPGYFP